MIDQIKYLQHIVQLWDQFHLEFIQTFEKILFFSISNMYQKSHACFESEWYNSLGRLQLYLIWLNDHFQVFIFEHIHSYTYLFFSLQRLRVTQPHHFRHKIVEKNVKINRLIFDLIKRKFHFKLIDTYHPISINYLESFS